MRNKKKKTKKKKKKKKNKQKKKKKKKRHKKKKNRKKNLPKIRRENLVAVCNISPCTTQNFSCQPPKAAEHKKNDWCLFEKKKLKSSSYISYFSKNRQPKRAYPK